MRGNPQAKRRDENELQYRSRLAREKQQARDRSEPIVPAETQRHGIYQRDFVTHVETNTKALTFRQIGLPSAIERWHRDGVPGFEEPAMDAMRRCIEMWEARPLIGSLAASYKPAIKGGADDYDGHVLKALDDTAMIERLALLFHPAHWRVFEAVVRHDRPLSESGMETNAPQSTASARAIVGTVANIIAMRLGC